MRRDLVINTYSYIWRLSASDAVAHLADQGYRSVELLVNWPHLWPRELDGAARKRLGALIAERDMRVMALNPPMLDLNLVSPAPEMRRYTVDHYLDVIRLAGELSAPFVLVVPGRTHPLLPAPPEMRDGWFSAALEELDRAAEVEGVRLIIENVPASVLPQAPDLMAALDRIGNDRLGVVYDVANAVFAREDPSAGLEAVASRLDLVHLSDTGVEAWRHSRLGTGVVPFGEVVSTLKRIDYAGPTVLEISSEEPDADIAAGCRMLKALGWEVNR